jgi:hypothetical protein
MPWTSLQNTHPLHAQACYLMWSGMCVGYSKALQVRAGAGERVLYVCIIIYLPAPRLSSTCIYAQAHNAQFFGEQRTTDGRGVAIPSQKRFVRYFSLLLEVRVREGREGADHYNPLHPS